MNINWEIMKALAVYLAIATAVVMMLTHLAAWIVRRLKGRAPATPEAPMKIGYDSLEEFRKDAEELSVGDLLERCAGQGVPPNKALGERRKKERESARVEADPAGRVSSGSTIRRNFRPWYVRPAAWATKDPGGVGSGPRHLGSGGSWPDRNIQGYPWSGPRPERCPDCRGHGMKGFGMGVPETCRTCKGSGLTA